MEFKDKVAISTGAASGMGLLFAESFAALGGHVVMCDVNESVLIEKANEINERGAGRALAVVCDVCDYSQVKAAVGKAKQTFGRIDIVANFAGGYVRRLKQVDPSLEFPEVPIEIFDFGIDLNLKGPFYFTHAVLPVMREQRSGLILYLGSISGMEGDGSGMEYPACKSALMNGLVKSAAQYGSRYGIRAVCVSPGPVLTRAAMANMKTLLGRAAEPKEIIDLILYLASEKGAFITGENIMIDGGRNAMWRGN